MIYPNHLQIEVVNGLCTARCSMCAFPTWTRKPKIMDRGTFLKILSKFMPYQKHLDFLSLQGFGESLIDKGLPEKVKIAKDMGFKSVGFATNCTELSPMMAHALFEAGLDTLICSVDGVTKETHEAIRVGTDYGKVLNNIISFMLMRPRFGKTKVIIRFIRQKANEHEWDEFKDYWGKFIEPVYGDAIISFDIVDCDNKVKDFKDKEVHQEFGYLGHCDQLYNRLIVFSDGEVALCCADDNGRFNLGNVLETDPMEIYNNKTFTYYRKMNKEMRLLELDLCKTCTIPKSQQLKDEVE